MSQAAPARPRVVQGKHSFGIVASEFNGGFVEALLEHATAELRTGAPAAEISIVRVPGAFEIPVVVQEMARAGEVDALLAIGVIIQGETPHAAHLARSVTDALQRIAVEQGVPVINCVLSLANETQAKERCLGEKINRGTEAAHAALRIAHVMRELRARAGG